MPEAELVMSGCPVGGGEQLLRFATRQVVEDVLCGFPKTADQVAAFIRVIAVLRWGTAKGTAAYMSWLRAGQRRCYPRAYGLG
jgi:hypothetical protein